MSSAAKSIFAFGIYLLLLGGLFLVFPNRGLQLFGLPTTNEPWIRIGGVGAIGLGYYYLRAALSETTVFFSWTLQARPVAALGFAALVVLRLADPILLLLGVIDLLGAIWTGLALRATRAALTSQRPS